jgi:hypothetical protein
MGCSESEEGQPFFISLCVGNAFMSEASPDQLLHTLDLSFGISDTANEF